MMQRSDSIDALATALAKAQAQIKSAPKDKIKALAIALPKAKHPSEEARLLRHAYYQAAKSGRQHALRPLHKRIVDRVVFGPSECWHWIGPANKQGYGRMTHEGRMQMVHRLSYIAFNQCALPPWPVLVLHKCDNPSCVNPDHLFIGDHADNYHDARLKNRRVYRGRASR